jgi:hypothetical protein
MSHYQVPVDQESVPGSRILALCCCQTKLVVSLILRRLVETLEGQE